MEKRIHITSVCWYKIYPAITGGQKGIALFNEALSNKYQLTCICSKNNEANSVLGTELLPILPTSKMQFFNFFNYRKILKQVRENESPLVIIEHPYYWPLYYFKKKHGFQLILHSHNIEYKRAKSRNKWFWRLIYVWERWAYQKADIVFFKTVEDQLFAQKKFELKTKNVHVLPYCTNLTEVPADSELSKEKIRLIHHIAAATKVLVFAASFDYEPNQKGLLHLLHEVTPEFKKQRSDFVILICGIGLEKFISANSIIAPKECVIVGAVEDMSLYFKAADVFINPVTNGEGIQTKNIDALAHNCTVVGYKDVANGIPDYVLGTKAFFANTEKIDEFVYFIKKALDPRIIDIDPQFYIDFSWKKRITDIFSNFE